MRVGSITDGPHQPSPQKPAPPVIEAVRLRWQVAATAWAVGVTIGPTERAARRCRAAPLDSGGAARRRGRYTACEEAFRRALRVPRTSNTGERRITTYAQARVRGSGHEDMLSRRPMARRGLSAIAIIASTFQTDPAVRRGSCRRSSRAPRSSSVMAEGRSDLGLHPPATSSRSTAPRNGNESPSPRV